VHVALMAATLLSLDVDGHVVVRPGVRGRIVKSRTVLAVEGGFDWQIRRHEREDPRGAN